MKPFSTSFTRILMVLGAVALAGICSTAEAGEIRALRVCADPGNMPLSNEKQEGYQNKIAEVIATSLGVGVTYDWRTSTERGLVRGTLDANACDVMLDMPPDMERVLTTVPLYRSTFVLVYRNDRGFNFKNLDDPKLKKLKVGVYQMSSIRDTLARHDIKNNVTTHFISYDGVQNPEHQPSYQVQRMIDGQLDVVGIWGSFAGYYKTIKHAPITLLPVNLMDDSEPLEFSMSLAVRRGDRDLQQRLNQAWHDEQGKIRKILDDYGVPLVQCADCVISGDLPSHGAYPDTAPKEQVADAATAGAYAPPVTLDQLKDALKHGADPNRELLNAVTAGDADRVRYLTAHGANIDTRDAEGYTPLQNAVRTRSDALAVFLVEQKADVNLTDSDGWTPLMLAAWRDSADGVRMLIAHGARIEASNAKGQTALCIAAQEGKDKAAAELIAAHADVNKSVGAAGYTPLMLAVTGGYDEVAELLIKNGAAVNAKNAGGITTLMIAAAGNRANTAKLLIQSGADVDAKGDQGMTALSIAQDRGNDAVLEVLRQSKPAHSGSASATTRPRA
jgi:quinoprotein dehydrogenase-associated probable ABC transporter substrate-binding protein